MTDTLEAPAVTPEPPRSPTRNPTAIAVAVVAAVAVIALGVVAIVAVSRDDTTTIPTVGTTTASSMMGPNGMMGSGSMMGGSTMNGPMMGHGTSSPTVPGARQIAISATSFKFTPNEIHVRAGEDVTIVLAASDIGHDFTIDELGFRVAAQPGSPGQGGLHAPATSGRYTAYCSIAGHRAAGMTATVVIDPS